nr:integrase, catalytic region, zinc finger, CCHC-type, peptidase aspartic, catalytic [Tanacetum cinerariifolium]
MEEAVEQHCVESNRFQDKIKEVLNENEQILEQAISKYIVIIVVTANVNNAYEPVNECERCVTLETELQKNFIKKECYDKLFKQYTTLEKHCISFEVDTQLEQEIFLRNNSSSQQSVSSFDQLFEINELKAQSQEKNMVIMKLKEIIKSLSGNLKEEKIKHELEEIEIINIELDHRVTKLVTENEHLKQTYKQLYDSIKSSHIRSKEQRDDLIKQVNIKSAENSDLNASLQEKVLVITALKDTLRKLKGKAVVDEVHTQEETMTLRKVVEKERLLNPLNTSLDYALNKTKKIRFIEPITSSGNTPIKTSSLSNVVFNKPMLSSTGVSLPTSASGSQPSGNTKKDRIRQTQSRAKKNKLEAYPRNVRTSFQNKKSVVKTKDIAFVLNSKLNVKSDLQCVTCNEKFRNQQEKCLQILDINGDPLATGKTFIIVGYACPLTRITTTAKVPLRKPIPLESNTSKPVYLDSDCSKHMTGDRSQLTNFVNKFLGMVKFGNDHLAKIMGYGDYKIGNVTISRVYFMERLGHNLFSVGQFCDSDLEVDFHQHTCFICNLEGVDLLTESQGNNLYTMSLGDMMASSPICLLSKASNTKSWLWHRRLSHLNFDAINHLARQGLV